MLQRPRVSRASRHPSGVTAESFVEESSARLHRGERQAGAERIRRLHKVFSAGRQRAEAQYYMGLIYDHGEQYDDAAQVFEAVAERYPDSPKAADAMYMKGVEYQQAKSDKKAIAAYRAFLKAVSEPCECRESASAPANADGGIRRNPS